MRAFCLRATIIFAAAIGTSSAVTEVRRLTTVTVDSSGYDTRTSGNGCSPDGCIPDNTRDTSRDTNSRWSCKDSIASGANGCWIEYTFGEPLDIARMRIAFDKGDENVRTLTVYAGGNYFREITSSGDTLGFQTFELGTHGTSHLTLNLVASDSESEKWLGITEVRIFA